jgi:hypothetical protein
MRVFQNSSANSSDILLKCFHVYVLQFTYWRTEIIQQIIMTRFNTTLVMPSNFLVVGCGYHVHIVVYACFL